MKTQSGWIGAWEFPDLPLGFVEAWRRGTWCPAPRPEYWSEAWERIKAKVKRAPWKRGTWAYLALHLLLTGCATGAVAPRVDTISFDRAQFAFMLAEVGQLIAVKCRDPKADKVECARLGEQYQAVRKQVMTPPAPSVAPAGGGLDMEQLMKLLGVLIGAAT